MSSTRTTITALLAAAALGLTGCAGGADPAASESTPAATEQGTTTTSAPAASGDEEAPAASTALTGMVGTTDDPEAYEIALLDADGDPVTSLPAGDYSLTFDDRSQMHNFRLSGPGDVDVATDVAGTDESTVEITLVAGTYTFVCDPHPGSMIGQVEVTG